MRTSPLVLDFRFSLGQALERAGTHQLWSSIDVPAAQEWIEHQIELRRISRKAAVRELDRRFRETWAAIHRLSDTEDLWYVVPIPKLLEAAGAREPEELLSEVLEWGDPEPGPITVVPDSLMPWPTLDLAERRGVRRESFQGLILDSGLPIAVQTARGSSVGDSAERPPKVMRREKASPGSARRGPTAHATRGTTHTKPPQAAGERVMKGNGSSKRIDAYPRIDTPPSAEVGVEFSVTVGLAADPDPAVSGAAFRIERPAGEVSFQLGIQLLAEGFKAPKGWRHEITVLTDDPFAASATIPLEALPIPGGHPLLPTGLVVVFIVDGAVVGHGSRRILVRGAGVPPVPPPGSPATVTPPPSGPIVLDGTALAADLEIVIAKPDHDPVTGRYQITFTSPHAVALPADPLPLDLGSDAASFAKDIIDKIVLYSGRQLQESVLRGQARSIADRLPSDFWGPLAAVSALLGGSPPSVLLISAEPFVPWELTVMSDPLDPAQAPYLGAQTRMGRWLMSPNGRPRPAKSHLDVKAMATMIGRYAGLDRLPMAEQEGETLQKRYRAIPLQATEDELLRLLSATLERDPKGVEAIHVAAHGDVDPKVPGSAALFLSDGSPLSPFAFRDASIGKTHEPFLFLNACMVGTSGELLGGVGGYPNACLLADFRALLGPLWAVDDGVAHDIALEFYARAFGKAGVDPESVGSILADFRRRGTSANPGGFEPTFLAYAFYGHPNLVLQPSWAA